MGQIKSAGKRHRQSLVRRDRNRAAKSRIRGAIKKAAETISSGADAAAELRVVQSILQKAASSGTLHRSTAARKMARLARRAHKKATASS